MSFQSEKLAPTTLKISFTEKLNGDNVAKIWHPCVALVAKEQPNSLLLDFIKVDYCDGAGIALIKKLQKQQARNNHKCILHNLKPELQKLLAYIEEQPDKLKPAALSHLNLPVHLGQITINILKVFWDNIVFIGMLSYQLFFTLLSPQKIRWHDFFRVVDDTGPQAVPIIALIGFLIGLISTFQAAPSFGDFGVQVYLVDLVGLGLVREMGPLLTSVLLAGRTTSSFAAEISTMKINQEIDALTTMGLNPIRFLIIPRVLATILVIPILEVLFIIFGLLGCLVVMQTLGYTVDTFTHRLYEAIAPLDYVGGLIKVFVFGLVIASVGCLHGIKTRFGAKAVGHSTTQAVVSSLIMLVVVDGIFAVIYYVLDI